MKKGFTLIELLIIMVIVGVLVTVALPKYKVAMERGRGLEGLANAAAVSEAANVYFVRNGNSYTGLTTSGFLETAGKTKIKHFKDPTATVSASGADVTVSVVRNGNLYTISFVNTDGEIVSRSCSGNVKYCKALGTSSCSGSTCSF